MSLQLFTQFGIYPSGQSENEPVQGFSGGGGEIPTHEPSTDPNDWECMEEDFLVPGTTVWSGQDGAGPGATFLVNNKIRLGYTGNNQGTFRGCMAEFDGTNLMDLGRVDNAATGAAAKPADVPWQPNDWRQMMYGMFKDGGAYKWYFVAAGPASDTHYYGFRAVGYAESTDLENWNFDTSGPVLTHDMLQSQYPEMNGHSNPEAVGRVYCHGAFKLDGETYLILSVSLDGDGNTYDGLTTCVKSSNGKTNWQRVDMTFDPSWVDHPEYQIVEYGGNYYTALKRYSTEGRGAMILKAPHPLGPWDFMNQTPMFFTGYNGNHRETVLFFYQGKWHVALTIRDSSEVEAEYGEGARIVKIGREI